MVQSTNNQCLRLPRFLLSRAQFCDVYQISFGPKTRLRFDRNFAAGDLDVLSGQIWSGSDHAFGWDLRRMEGPLDKRLEQRSEWRNGRIQDVMLLDQETQVIDEL